ncbi:MAG: FHA domain-containing protein [Mariprofundaceae bacterium]|nr:FHA domain-containing protein [Mariprofundaceae bacterium]
MSITSKLVLRFKGAIIEEYPLANEETTIGRKPNNTIEIDNLAVSGLHARVLQIGNKTILEDMGSTNGTLVNKKPVRKHVLQHGDIIMIGKHSLAFVDVNATNIPDETAEEVEDDMDKTMIISAKDREEMLSSGQKSGSQMPLAAVQVITGLQVGKSFDLNASITSIGKGDICKIKVKGLTVGKQAAIITRRPNGYHIAYLEGFSKVKVNGVAVGSEPITLKDGAIIELADMKMEFFIKEP